MYVRRLKIEKNLSSENSISSKTVLKNEGETKIFLGKQNVREFLPARHSLQEMLMGFFKVEMNGSCTVTCSNKEKKISGKVKKKKGNMKTVLF